MEKVGIQELIQRQAIFRYSLFESKRRQNTNTLLVFRGTHVAQAKAKRDRQTDGQIDRQMDVGQSDPFVALCFAGATETVNEPSAFGKKNTTVTPIMQKATKETQKLSHLHYAYASGSS